MFMTRLSYRLVEGDGGGVTDEMAAKPVTVVWDCISTCVGTFFMRRPPYFFLYKCQKKRQECYVWLHQTSENDTSSSRFSLSDKWEHYAHRHPCLSISVSLSNTECLVSAIMKLLSSSMRSRQGVKDRDRQGNQLSAARYFRSFH